MIRDIPTRWLLLLALLCAGLLPLMTVALVSYGTGRAQLKRLASQQLESVRDSKRAQLTRFFEERRRDVDLLARDPYLLSAFAELEGAFRSAGGAAGGRFAGHDRRRFDAPESYREVHDHHFPYLARFVDRRGYYDLLLLDATSGETCFSVEKERDFATTVADQPTALREVWHAVVREHREVLSDTRPYPPSANAAAQFVAAPIRRGERVVGVVALQIALTEVNAIMAERSGMATTGETWVVGADFRPRADSSRDPGRSVQASFLNAAGPRLENLASRRALGGETGAGIIDVRGRRVLAAWTPFDGAGARWALAAQVDEAEIDAQIDRALNSKVIALLTVSGVAVVILALLLSLLISRSVGSVGTQLVRLSDAVLRGDLGRRADESEVAVDFRGVVHRINDLVAAFVGQLDSLPVPAVLVDPTLNIRFANAAACALKGTTRERLVGRRCCEVFAVATSCADRCLVREALEQRRVVSAEVEGRGDQGRYLVTASPLLGPDGAVAGGFEVVIDRSEAWRAEREKRLLEERVVRMQRLEAVGTLAGGIAHDFNNILTYMFAYTDIVEGFLPEDSPAAPHLAQLVAAIERAANLVGQVLTFSREVQADSHPLDLGPLVKEAAKLVRASLPPSISLEVTIPDRPFTVMANPTQVHQVVLNLLTNAHQAMARAGGRLVVALSDAALAPDDPRVGVALPAGAYRVLEVSDTGCGMDSRTRERIFEPFFTTKPVGQGTGMGLALVHGIVTSCGGAVLVESAPGEGSTFRVFLPLVEASPATTRPHGPDAFGNGRRVLLVDDESRVCETSGQLLDSLGYRVRTFTRASEALAELAANATAYDVVVTDLSMPEVGGLQVARAARSSGTRLPVVLTTAYADRITPEEAREAGIAEVLLKPYRKSDLARVLHGLLAPTPR